MRLTKFLHYTGVIAVIALAMAMFSCKPQLSTVPNVVGLSQSLAESQIVAANLTMGSATEQFSEIVPESLVISQTPAGQTHVKPRTVVYLVISKGPDRRVVPNVVGLSQSAAEAAISAVGLVEGTVTQEFSETVPVGEVMSQHPADGTLLAPGTTVTYVVSKGPDRRVVPNVVGLSQSAAEATINATGLVAGTVTEEFDETIPFGVVISQSLAADTLYAPGTLVSFVVSKGPDRRIVPNLVGLPQTAAESVIRLIGLVVGTVTQEFSATVLVGKVISQDPVAGALLAPGGAITLAVSKGPEPVSVPDVVGMTHLAAQSAIIGTGLFVGTLTEEYSLAVPVDHVIRQDPAGTTSVVPGSAVNLVLSRGPDLHVYLEGDTVTMAGAQVVLAGQVYPGTATGVGPQDLVGIVFDGCGYLYHPALGDVTISDITSRRAVGWWLIDRHLDTSKNFPGNILLGTGLRVTQTGAWEYTFTNTKKRWAAVVSPAEPQAVLLQPSAALVDVDVIEALSEADSLVTISDGDFRALAVDRLPVATHGAIASHPLFPFVLGTTDLPEDLQHGSLDAFLGLNASIEDAIQADPDTFARVNTIDAVLMMIDGIQSIAGLIPGECIFSLIDATFLISTRAVFLGAMTQGDELSENALIDSLKEFGEEMALCVTSEKAPVSSVVGTLVDIVGAFKWVIDDEIGGSVDTSTTLAYDNVIGIQRPAGETKTIMLPGNVPLEMVWIPQGSFMMGRYSDDPTHNSADGPQHQVVFAQGFWMGRFELTKTQWMAMMGTTPWAFDPSVSGDPDSPAVYVSWDDAQSFVSALNDYTGLAFWLPSEAQWEYACRAGTETRFYWGDDQNGESIGGYAWWDRNTSSIQERYAHVVGMLLPNAWGLYDMSGNVREWCQDWYHSNYVEAPMDGSAWEVPADQDRVTRGGSWLSRYSSLCSSYYRYHSSPRDKNNHQGFRVGLTENDGPAEGEGRLLTETVLLPGGVPLEMLGIPPGSFLMGRYPGEQDSSIKEDPQHRVTFARRFWLGRYELSKAQWKAVMGFSPWQGHSDVLDDPNSPAVLVSWEEIQDFIAALNSYTGQTFRLPSEAEWEYACRAGTTTRFYWGDDPSYVEISDYAWWTGNAWSSDQQYAHVVGMLPPNAWGLYDMSGNVSEWCEDDWREGYTGAPVDGRAWIFSPRAAARTVRGGGYYESYVRCRSASRNGFAPQFAWTGVGFRLAR